MPRDKVQALMRVGLPGWRSLVAAGVCATALAAALPAAALAAAPPPPPLPASPPTVIATPTILGTATVGSTLFADPGVFGGVPPMSLTYQWWYCADGCQPIFGATHSQLRVTAADIGFQIVYTVTASNSAGSQVAAPAMTATVPAPSRTLQGWLAPLTSVGGPGARLETLTRTGTYVTSFNAAVVGRATVTWTARETVGAVTRTVTVATGTGAITFTAPRTRVAITLTSAGRALLAHRHSAHLIATARFVYAYGTACKTSTLSRPLTLQS